MMTTGIMDLMKAGVVTGARKQVDVGKTVFAFALGSAEMYEFIDKNPDCWTGRGEEVNNPYLIARNDNQVSHQHEHRDRPDRPVLLGVDRHAADLRHGRPVRHRDGGAAVPQRPLDHRAVQHAWRRPTGRPARPR